MKKTMVKKATAKKVVKPMMKAGGSTAGKTTPLYPNNPLTEPGRMVKKGGVAKTTYKKSGTTKKAVSAGMKKGGSAKSFPDINKDGKVTKADVLMGRGVIKKKVVKKKSVKPNPLKVFNDNNAKARMKAGGVMKSYKKSLKKAQEGVIQGPMTEEQSKMLNSTANNMANLYSSNTQLMNNNTPNNSTSVNDPNIYDQKKVNAMKARMMNNMFKQKKGGSVKRKKK
jgi:hypothetical protein